MNAYWVRVQYRTRALPPECRGNYHAGIRGRLVAEIRSGEDRPPELGGWVRWTTPGNLDYVVNVLKRKARDHRLKLEVQHE